MQLINMLIYISFLNFDGNSKFIQQIPRFVLEALGVI